MTDNINKETTDNNAETNGTGSASEYTYQNNAFPTMPTIASDSPWLSANDAQSHDWILQDVGHHDPNFIALDQT